ncbi:MAG: hypothetical protein ABI740_07175 [Alphaproteobacteria bacterium]
MTKRIALLIAQNLASNAPDRRADAYLFDVQRRVMEAAFTPAGLTLEVVRWTEEAMNWGQFDAALVLNCWDYQDRHDAFLERLSEIEAAGVAVFNPLDLVRWNIRKTYLRDFEGRGVPIVPTLWTEAPQADDIQAAFTAFNSEEVVLKRQVGGGARGQARYARATAPTEGQVLDRPGMIQPLIQSIVTEGEYSFLFVDGEFSHALVKRAADGDYRIQEAYGGRSMKVEPSPADKARASAVLEALDAPPLYARVDMVRGADGGLMLMELEVLEPYLFPAEGPAIGVMLAAALKRRLG